MAVTSEPIASRRCAAEQSAVTKPVCGHLRGGRR